MSCEGDTVRCNCWQPHHLSSCPFELHGIVLCLVCACFSKQVVRCAEQVARCSASNVGKQVGLTRGLDFRPVAERSQLSFIEQRPAERHAPAPNSAFRT